MKTSGQVTSFRLIKVDKEHRDTIEEGRQEVLLTADALVKGLVSEPIEIDWDKFKTFVLASCNPRTAVERVRYAKRFHYIVTTPEGPSKIRTDLLQLSESNRQDVMKALANLTKYMGIYEEWKKIQKQFGLKWTSFSPQAEAQYFEETFYNDSTNYTSMFSWIKDACKQIPAEYAAILIYATLTGLRAEEAIESIKKLQNPAEREIYINKDKGTLEHFKFPSTFIRRTKKAYISIITDDILKVADQTRPDACYRTLQSHLFSRKLESHVKYCRKVFGTFLRMNGIESEFIDMIQGRKAKSVFAKHYYRPDWNEQTEKIRVLLRQLHQEIIGKTNGSILEERKTENATTSKVHPYGQLDTENKILRMIMPIQLEGSRLSLKYGSVFAAYIEAVKANDSEKAQELLREVEKIRARMEENTKTLEQLAEQEAKLKGLELDEELAKFRGSQ